LTTWHCILSAELTKIAQLTCTTSTLIQTSKPEKIVNLTYKIHSLCIFQLLDKVCLQLQTIFDDTECQNNIPLQKEIIMTFSKIMPGIDVKVRDDCKCV